MAMSRELLIEVQDFLNRNGDRYRKLLADVEGMCRATQTKLGSNVVRDIYTRRGKQGDEFKTPAKIAKALALMRKRDPSALPRSIEDIIGATVLVFYPDQIAAVAEQFRTGIPFQADITKDEHISKKGYHAHHMVFMSKDARHLNLCCEVQIKTMLHDAWAAKTHDLNYKPHGRTDHRLSRLMQVFGDALESIEAQSELLRNLIVERWNAEAKRRGLVRTEVLKALGPVEEKASFSEAARKVKAQIDKTAADLSTARESPESWGKLFADITDVGRDDDRTGTWLLVHLAMTSSVPEHITVATEKVIEFLSKADSLLKSGGICKQEIWALPMALSACGNFAGAIDASERLLALKEGLDKDTVAHIKFNLANYIVDEVCFGTPQEDEETSKLRARIDELLRECSNLQSEQPDAFTDLRGMIEVALSDDPAVLRGAIDNISSTMQKGGAHPEYANAYAELHIRLAWRRLLEVEAGRP